MEGQGLIALSSMHLGGSTMLLVTIQDCRNQEQQKMPVYLIKATMENNFIDQSFDHRHFWAFVRSLGVIHWDQCQTSWQSDWYLQRYYALSHGVGQTDLQTRQSLLSSMYHEIGQLTAFVIVLYNLLILLCPQTHLIDIV